MKKTLLLGFITLTLGLTAQNVGIGTNTPLDYAKLDISSTTSGLQLPRMSTVQRTTLDANISGLSAALSAQYSGMIVYDVTTNTMYMWDASKPTNGAWVNILDSDASLADADSDATNELQNLSNTTSGTDRTINITNGTGTTISVADNDNSITNEIQDLSLSGNTLSLSSSLPTVDLSGFKDHDWYESPGTSQADNIADNIYTNGNVGIGVSSPLSNLHIVGDATMGRQILAPSATVNQSSELVFGEDDDATFGMKFTYDGGLNKLFLRGYTTGFTTNNTPHLTILRDDGRVGIGTDSPLEKLSVAPDENESAEIGRAHIGYMGHSDWAGFSHIDINSVGGYALLQNSDGRTLLNSSTGQGIEFRINNSSQFEMESDGDLSVVLDNSIKMPNNIRWVENRAATTFTASSSWRSLNYTGTMNVESGNVIKLDANSLLRLTGGSGDDDFYIRVFIDGTGGCADSYSDELGWIRHSEGGGDHDNFTTYSYMDVVSVACDGTMRFRLEIKNTGDDAWQYSDAILTAIKF